MSAGPAVVASRRPTTNLAPGLRYERSRLLSSRSGRRTVAAALLLTLVNVVSLRAAAVDGGLSGDVLVSNLTLSADLTGIPVVPSLVGLLGILSVTDDLTTPLGATTFLVVPVRSRAVAAKLIVVSCVGVATSLLLSLGAFVAVHSFVGTDASVSWAAAIGGHLLASILWTVWGVGLGLLVRRAAGAITLFLGLPLVVEVLLGLVLVGLDVPTRLVSLLLPFRSMVRVMSNERPLLSAAVASAFVGLVLAAGWLGFRSRDI